MELVLQDIPHIGLARECIFLSKRKVRLMEKMALFDESIVAIVDPKSERQELLHEMSVTTKRWTQCFLDLMKRTVQKEMSTGNANYDLVFKVFRYSVVCDHVSKAIVHITRSKRLLESFNIQSELNSLDVILTGGLV